MSDLKRKWPPLAYPHCGANGSAYDSDIQAAFNKWLEANIPEPLLSQLAPREPMREIQETKVGWWDGVDVAIPQICLSKEWNHKRVKVTIEEIL